MRACIRESYLVYPVAMADLAQQFADAQARIKPVTVPSATMLELYALFKQATFGDATGERPGILDVRGRAKYDAWAHKKGTTKDAAMQAYIALVAKLAP
jgi:carboxylesterase